MPHYGRILAGRPAGPGNTGPVPGVALVGVTTYSARAAWGPWDRPAAVVPATYVEMVAAVGARPVLLPPFGSSAAGTAAGAPTVVDVLDALVLVGGGDVDPAAFGRSSHPETTGVDALRDASELALLAAALHADLPILAICRGHQLLNVHLGGTLHQHVPEVVGHGDHQPGPGQFSDIDIRTVPGTRTAAIFGERLTVPCSHHQAIDRLGNGLVATAYARQDPALVEAVELDGHRFVLGVQWHPEEAGDTRPVAALVDAAR
jgi:gamma-glutamyl-gamma-aminobutyrate hydrolase PuuD